jgi:Tfp pilus assembly protein PilP
MLNKNLLTIALLAVAASAQTATPAKPATTTKPLTTKQTTAPAKPASQSVQKRTSAPATSKPGTPVKTTTAKTAPAPAKTTTPAPKPAAKVVSPAKIKADIQAKVEKPAAEKEAAIKTAGRRDPFVSPLRLQEAKAQSAVCATGVRCLIIDQVTLKGIVKTQQGMIAMVENPARKQYNLRERDSVFNGQVMKITGDTLIFRENITDSLGHQSTREVVKKVTAPVI